MTHRLNRMPTNKKIFGLTGLLASGKGTAAKYFEEKHNAGIYRFSTALRDVCKRVHLEQTRDNLVKMSECLRATFGEDLLSKAMARDTENDMCKIVVVDGVRRMEDVAHLKLLPNFILVAISADPATRYERLIKRGENSDDIAKTYEQFLADHKRSTEVSILDVVPQATEQINNNGSLEELHQQIDALINKYETKN